jgi:hypothetical protein
MIGEIVSYIVFGAIVLYAVGFASYEAYKEIWRK